MEYASCSAIALNRRLERLLQNVDSGVSPTGVRDHLTDRALEAKAIRAIDDWVMLVIQRGLTRGNLSLRLEALLYDANKWVVCTGWGGPRYAASLCNQLQWWRDVCGRLPT